MPNSPLLEQLFFTEPAGRFALGHVIRSGQEVATADEILACNDTGHWRCDINDHNRLTWSDKVYELFGMPVGTQVERDQAVARYCEHSKGVLERLRAFAINRKCGFILDAAIHPNEKDNRWIRVLAVPILENDRVVGLQGLNRAL
jgi:hypothetical protein